MTHQIDNRYTQLYAPALLHNESIDEYNFLREALKQQIQPKTFIEHLWVSGLVDGEHEKQRLRQFRARTIRSNTPQALRNLLRLITDVSESDQVDYLVAKWFTNKSVRRTVSRILRDFGSDEVSIDAEALRLSMEYIAGLDMRMAELEQRRDRILDRIEDHRAGLATQVMAKLEQRQEDNTLVSARAGED
jgi:hypothetical protein